MHLARLGHRAWRRAQMLKKQTAKMARAHPDTLCERFHSALVQPTLTDQAQGAGNGIWSSQPSRGAGRTFRPTTQTRAKARLGCCCGGRKVANVLLLRVRCRANRPAIDSAGKHADKELTVEARVARQPGSRTDLPIQFHIRLKLMITRLRLKTWTFPDYAVKATTLVRRAPREKRLIERRRKLRQRSKSSRSCCMTTRIGVFGDVLETIDRSQSVARS